jgi:hypothetical protein
MKPEKKQRKQKEKGETKERGKKKGAYPSSPNSESARYHAPFAPQQQKRRRQAGSRIGAEDTQPQPDSGTGNTPKKRSDRSPA